MSQNHFDSGNIWQIYTTIPNPSIIIDNLKILLLCEAWFEVDIQSNKYDINKRNEPNAPIYGTR